MDFESRSATGIVGRVSEISTLPTFIPFKGGLDWWATGERAVGAAARAVAVADPRSSPASRPASGHAGSHR